MASMCEATTRVLPGAAVIELSGEVDGSAADVLTNAYQTAVGTHADLSTVVLDFAAVDYINSTGIALIVVGLAFVQIIVYTGAVLMLFLFVIMLIGVSHADSIVETIKRQRMAAGLAAIGLFVILILGIGHAAIGPATPSTAANGANNLSGLADLIFTTYVFPFEVTGALLITAALGAMVLAHRERIAPKPTQRDLAARRLASGQLAPDPSPGVYALHDAADRPALLPDGSTSDLSVSPTLSQREVSDARQFVRPEGTVEITAESGELEPAPSIPAAPAGRADS